MLTYNRANEIHRSLDSLLNQTYENFELIINDDASTDDTEEVCRTYEQSDERVKYVRNKENLKYAGNNNAAIRRANTDYVGLVHGGDLYEPFMLERWVNALNEYDSAAFVFHGHYRKTNGKPLRHGYPPLVDGYDLLEKMLQEWGSPVYGITMVRKSCVIEVGGFDESLPILADVDMWMRLLNKYNAAYINEPLVRYMPRESNHFLKGVNWDEEEELMRIHRTNIKRRFSADRDKFSVFMRRFRRRRLQRFLFKMGWCIRHREWDLVRRGCKEFRNTDSCILNYIADMIEYLA